MSCRRATVLRAAAAAAHCEQLLLLLVYCDRREYARASARAHRTKYFIKIFRRPSSSSLLRRALYVLARTRSASARARALRRPRSWRLEARTHAQRRVKGREESSEKQEPRAKPRPSPRTPYEAGARVYSTRTLYTLIREL